jgi:hypothetical protein
MFGSNILDVAIGLVFLFLLLSLLCSAANELLEGIIKKRAKDLEQGISELIGDPTKTKDFLAKIYSHGLVNSLYRGTYGVTPKRKLPSYIPSRNFALALISIVKDSTNTIPIPANVHSAFAAFETTAANDAAQLQKSVEDWYNTGMDRVAGWYKRRTQIIIFVMGAVLCVLVNADCIDYAKRLSTDSSLRQSVVAMAEATAKKDPSNDTSKAPVDQIKDYSKSLTGIGLPIGWAHADGTSPDYMKDAPSHIMGWVLSAFAISLGAPFWFDMLNKIMVIRSTVKPHEKSKEEGSKDPSGKKSIGPTGGAAHSSADGPPTQ